VPLAADLSGDSKSKKFPVKRQIEETTMIRIISTFSLLWCFAIQVTGVWACPACNIHNYLAESVKNSENIFVGKFIRQIDGHTAEVEVIRVIRGSNQPNSIAKFNLSCGTPVIEGESYLFSDPKHFGLTFPMLPLEYEDEVLFLAQENPEITDLAEAIKRVQGISKVTKETGLAYLERNPEVASEALIAAIRELRTSFLKGEIKNFGDYRLSNLLEALMIAPTKESQEFLVQETENLLKGESKAVDLDPKRSFASERGEYLQAILVNIAIDKELQQKIRSSIFEKIPNLQDQKLVDVTYALSHSNTASPRKISNKIENRKQRDAVALGLFSAGNRMASVWDWEDAFANWDPARKIAMDSRIRQLIEKRIDDTRENRRFTATISDYMGFLIFLLPIPFFVFTKKAWRSFLLSATLGTLILWCIILYSEVHTCDSDLNFIFCLSMLSSGIIFIVICAIEILILKSIPTLFRRFRNSAPQTSLPR
jgi:hypothetical protein